MTYRMLPGLLLATLLLGGCGQQEPAAAGDIERIKREVLQKQEELLRIHLDLDKAASEISDAQLMAQDGNCSGAEFHAAEAYRRLKRADGMILDLGRDLQAVLNLDARGGR